MFERKIKRRMKKMPLGYNNVIAIIPVLRNSFSTQLVIPTLYSLVNPVVTHCESDQIEDVGVNNPENLAEKLWPVYVF